MNAALGLYDRDHSEKEYWVWESDGSEYQLNSIDSDTYYDSESEDELKSCVANGFFPTWSPIKPNSCMYPFSERFVIIFLLDCAQLSKKLMTNIVELLLLKPF